MFAVPFKDALMMWGSLWESDSGTRADTSVSEILYNKYKIWYMLVTN